MEGPSRVPADAERESESESEGEYVSFVTDEADDNLLAPGTGAEPDTRNWSELRDNLRRWHLELQRTSMPSADTLEGVAPGIAADAVEGVAPGDEAAMRTFWRGSSPVPSLFSSSGRSSPASAMASLFSSSGRSSPASGEGSPSIRRRSWGSVISRMTLSNRGRNGSGTS